MTTRTQDGVTWTYTFDAENRLTQVTGNGVTTTMVYDGNGARIRRIVDDGQTVTTTLYIAGMEIESVDGTETQRTVYYGAGGAFRILGGEHEGLYYRHSDHLGSTSVLSDSAGLRGPVLPDPATGVKATSLPASRPTGVCAGIDSGWR